MKKHIIEKVEIPQGTVCNYSEGIIKCTRGTKTLEKKILVPSTEVKIRSNEIILECKNGNQKNYKSIISSLAHIKNLFKGLEDNYVYKLESCNVHFPMTLKIEKNKLIINNFLGEKVPREAKILPGVEVILEGAKITIQSPNLEAAGQTAANFERATKLTGRDRRIFQDGIYITEKPRRKNNAL